MDVSLASIMVLAGRETVLVDGAVNTVISHAWTTKEKKDSSKKNFFIVLFPFIHDHNHHEGKTLQHLGEFITGQVDRIIFRFLFVITCLKSF